MIIASPLRVAMTLPIGLSAFMAKTPPCGRLPTIPSPCDKYLIFDNVSPVPNSTNEKKPVPIVPFICVVTLTESNVPVTGICIYCVPPVVVRNCGFIAVLPAAPEVVSNMSIQLLDVGAEYPALLKIRSITDAYGEISNGPCKGKTVTALAIVIEKLAIRVTLLASFTGVPTLTVLPVTETPPLIATGPDKATVPPAMFTFPVIGTVPAIATGPDIAMVEPALRATVPDTVTGPLIGTLPLIVTEPVTLVLPELTCTSPVPPKLICPITFLPVHTESGLPGGQTKSPPASILYSNTVDDTPGSAEI